MLYKNYIAPNGPCTQKKNIVKPEQEAGKKEYGELLNNINKSIMKEVRSIQWNLVTVWLDYRKAFDSILNSWLLHIAKFASQSL